MSSSAGRGPRQCPCRGCLARSWLLGRLAAHLERARARALELLAVGDQALIAAVAGRSAPAVRAELAAFDDGPVRGGLDAAGIHAICRHCQDYPPALHDLPAPPAVLFTLGRSQSLGGIANPEGVALVGARRASAYGIEVARSLGQRLAVSGVAVVSGMALGIDTAAHGGALAAGGETVAVLPCAVDRPYPASHRALHRRIIERGLVVSELPPGAGPWRWTFVARNRIIAGLAGMTVVVEAGARSGALVTARIARELGRPVGAVPGRITAPGAAGPHRLIAGGATLVSDAQVVLDALFGVGVRPLGADPRPPLARDLRALLAAIAAGRDTAGALTAAGVDPEQGLAGLAALELSGYLRRGAGGRYTVSP